jgi:hypothetical protein
MPFPADRQQRIYDRLCAASKNALTNEDWAAIARKARNELGQTNPSFARFADWRTLAEEALHEMKTRFGLNG